MCRQILLLVDFAGFQIWKLDIAGILQNQCFGAIADNYPLAVFNQKRGHIFVSSNLRKPKTDEAETLCYGSNAAKPCFVANIAPSRKSVCAVEQPAGDDLGLNLGGTFENIENASVT
jgi:hypothetical protein